MDDTDVIIVAFNAGDLLEAAVASALPDVVEARVILADTGTTDGSIERVRRRHPGVRVLDVGPRGFAAGNNAGIAASSGRYVMLLNPDAELRPGALAALVAYAEEHPRMGIVGAAILDPDGTPQANSFGRFPTLLSAAGLRLWRLWQRLRGNRRLAPRRFDRPTPVDWVTGAGMLARREAIEDAGPMDDGFFLYYEDVEWCHRMRDHRWDVVVEPAAEVVHHLGSAGGRSAAAQRAYRAGFFRYCRIYRLRGLALFARLGLLLRGESADV